MARLPTVDIPSADSLRPINFSGEKKLLKIDVSKVGSGAIYGGKQLQQLGQQITKQEEERADFDYENQKAKALVALSKIEDEEEKNPDWKNSQKRFDEATARIEEEAGANLRSPKQKERFQQWMLTSKERTASRVRGTSFKYEASHGNNEVNERLNEMSSLAARDRENVEEYLSSASGIIDGAKEKGYLSEEKAGILKREWRSNTIKGVIQKMDNASDAMAAIDEYESKGVLSVEDSAIMRDQAKRKGMENFGWSFVNERFDGKNNEQVRKAILKLENPEERKAADTELNTRIRNQEADKSLREQSAFSHYVSSAANGVNYSQWAKDNPGTDLALNPSTRLSLIHTAQSEGKQPKTTPDQVLTDLSSMYQRAQETGNYAPFHKAVDDNLPYMSREDQTKYLNIRKDLTVPKSEERRLKHQSLLDAQTSGMSKANKAKMRLELERFEDRKIQEKGRLPTDDEVRVEFFAPAMLEVDKPMSWSDVKVYEGVEDDPDRIENAYFLTKRAREMGVDLDEDQLLESLVDLKKMREQAENEAYQFLQERRIDPKKNQMLYNKAVETKWKKLRDSYDFRSGSSETR